MRHPAHWNIRVEMFAAFGEGNIQRFCSRHCIFKKQLIKITHAIKQQGLRILCLDVKILGHHRRHGFVSLGFYLALQRIFRQREGKAENDLDVC